MKLNEVEINGMYIPKELAANNALTWTEKAIYSIYYYYTFFGDGSCHITNENIAARLGIKLSTMRDAKRQLKNDGWIETNGGIKVTALRRVTKSDTITGGVEGDEIRQAKVTKSDRQGDEIRHHNKENKELNKDYLLTSDSHFTREETGKVSKLTEVPEWMDEVEPMEPFEQYSDMGDGYDNPLQADESEEPTAPSVSKVSKETLGGETTDTLQGDEPLTATENNNPPSNERETDPTTDNITSSKGTETTPTQADLKLADLRDFQETDGTTTHTEDENLSNGEKMASTGAIETKGNVGEGKGESWLTIQQRKEQQAELNRKWENYLVQAPSMARDDRDRYFGKFMSAVAKYYTGDYIQRTKDRMTTEFNEATGASKPTHGLKEFTADTWRDTMVFLQNPKNTFGLTWERFNSNVTADYSLTDTHLQKLRYAFKRWVEEPMEPVVIGYGDNDLDDLPFSNPITKPVTLDVFIERVEIIKRDSMEKQAIKKERENDLPF